MKRITLFIAALIISSFAFGQRITLQGGASISKLDWYLEPFDMQMFEKPITNFPVMLGIDYLDKPYFHLSSNVGFLRKGGQTTAVLTNLSGDIVGDPIIVKATLDYITFNTTANLKYHIKNTVTPFISVGPRVDFLIDNSKEFKEFNREEDLRKIAYGLVLGGGVSYDFSRFQIGVHADYYLDFSKVAEWTEQVTGTECEITTQTFTLNLMLGYKL